MTLPPQCFTHGICCHFLNIQMVPKWLINALVCLTISLCQAKIHHTALINGVPFASLIAEPCNTVYYSTYTINLDLRGLLHYISEDYCDVSQCQSKINKTDIKRFSLKFVNKKCSKSSFPSIEELHCDM